MNEKIQALQCFIENRVFAPSHSAFAQMLGYKGKMVIYRFMEGKTRESTVNAIWKKLQKEFSLSEEELYTIAAIFQKSKIFQALMLPEMLDRDPSWIQHAIIAFFEDYYDDFSDKFRKETAPFLKDLKKDDPQIYWGIISLFYIKAMNVDVYQKEFEATMHEILAPLDKLLFYVYPERRDAHLSAVALQSHDLTKDTSPDLWTLLHFTSMLLRFYADPDFRKEVSKIGRIFSWDSCSYWRIPNIPHRPDEDVWIISENRLGRSTNGFYTALRLKTGKDIESFTLKESLNLIFWTIDNENESPILQAINTHHVEKKNCFYQYEYDENAKVLYIEPIEKNQNFFDLPKAMQMIDLREARTTEEKVWSRIMNKFDKEQCEKILLEALATIGGIVDLSDEYDIKDVILNRTHLMLIIQKGNEESKYQIPIDSYLFLSKINPSQTIMVFQFVEDGLIYVVWTDLGYSIRLSEFTKIT